MEQLSVADVLDRAADLIEPEGAWSNDAVALRSSGAPTYAQDPKATCFCALGAIWRLTDRGSLHRREVEDAAKLVMEGSVAVFNDAPGRSQSEVVAKLREAATLARAQGGE